MLPPSTILGKKILVLTAHPDDESYLAGGTIFANSQAGGQTFLICATLGEKGMSHLQVKVDEPELEKIRDQELTHAAEALGVTEVTRFHFPDGKVDQHEQELFTKVSKLWVEIRPEIIISFGADGITGHKDHKAVSRVAEQLAKHFYTPLATFCVAHQMASEAMDWIQTRRHTKDHYENISATDYQEENIIIPIDGEIKMKALKCYGSQIDENDPFHGFPEHLAQALLQQECFYVKL